MAEVSDYVNDVKKYSSNVDEALVTALAKTYRLVLGKADSAFVSCSQASELVTVRENFLKKKLGLSFSDEDLDAAIKDVCNTMGSSNPRKSRLTFYYLLTEKFNAKSTFVK